MLMVGVVSNTSGCGYSSNDVGQIVVMVGLVQYFASGLGLAKAF